VAAFMDRDEFTERMEQLVDQVESVPLAPGAAEVFFPGEIEARAERHNAEHGLTLPDQTLDDLRELANIAEVTPINVRPL